MIFVLGFIAGIVALSLLALLSGVKHQRKFHSWLIRAMYGWADFWYAFARATDMWIVFFRDAYRQRQERVPANEIITTEVLDAMVAARERQTDAGT